MAAEGEALSRGFSDVTAARLHYLCAASLIALILLCIAWELWLAPLRPGGSWLVLKVLPLLAPLHGVLQARVYTLQWASMLILAYFAEGIVRAYSEAGIGALLAGIEITLTLAFFLSCILLARAARQPR